jgi:peptide deformylase
VKTRYLVQDIEPKKYSDCLFRKGFQVNMRLYNSNAEYKKMILSIVEYMELCNFTGLFAAMSGANIGVPLNLVLLGTKRLFINPKIIAKSRETTLNFNGCGSISSRQSYMLVEFPTWITVQYFDREGVEHVENFNGMDCILLQHEIWHNQGIMIYEKVPKETKFQTVTT